jgi:hypothetical protein
VWQLTIQYEFKALSHQSSVASSAWCLYGWMKIHLHVQQLNTTVAVRQHLRQFRNKQIPKFQN